MNEEPKTGSKKVIAGVLALVVVLVVVGAIILTKPKSTMALADADKSSSSSSTTASTSNATYKDGTYTSEGSYDSPGGTESVKVTLTLASNTVTDSTVVSEANDPTASSYQSIFISNYKKSVVGKNISDIKLSNVSGSSLTSMGFNSALQKIEAQAKA
jgi:uncharacterized protein with FMN-binding domain